MTYYPSGGLEDVVFTSDDLTEAEKHMAIRNGDDLYIFNFSEGRVI